MRAANKGHTELVESLLARGAQVNCVDKVGQQRFAVWVGFCWKVVELGQEEEVLVGEPTSHGMFWMLHLFYMVATNSPTRCGVGLSNCPTGITLSDHQVQVPNL